MTTPRAVKLSVRKQIDALADELFRTVEKSQGQAFISDGWNGSMTKAEFFEWVQDRLDWNNEASNEIRKFLRKHKSGRAALRSREGK
jgi:hypothetical protein